MKASIKHANITPPSILTLFPTSELTNQSLDTALVADWLPTGHLKEPRGYSQLHCRADQPVTRCRLVPISEGHPIMRVFPVWVITISPLVHKTVSGVCKDSRETKKRKKKRQKQVLFFCFAAAAAFFPVHMFRLRFGDIFRMKIAYVLLDRA